MNGTTIDTRQTVESGTKEGRKFLRKVIRENMELRWNEEWKVRADEFTGWKLEFRRDVKADEAGNADREIRVQTDIEIRNNVKSGSAKTFHDSQEVTIPDVQSVNMSGPKLAMVVGLILDGYRLELNSSRGSQNSSKHGIGEVSLDVTRRINTRNGDSFPGYPLTVCTTTTVNGRTVSCGSVSLHQ
jgi:hypothetical protein